MAIVWKLHNNAVQVTNLQQVYSTWYTYVYNKYVFCLNIRYLLLFIQKHLY